MAELRISIEDDALERARTRADAQGTSVHALLADYIRRLGAPTPPTKGIAGWLAIAEGHEPGAGPGGRAWTRGDIYDDP